MESKDGFVRGCELKKGMTVMVNVDGRMVPHDIVSVGRKRKGGREQFVVAFAGKQRKTRAYLRHESVMLAP